MCKHKSGGMSKASGNSDSQDGLSDRSTASNSSSQDCPQGASGGAPAAPAHQDGPPPSTSQIRNYSVTTVINMQPPGYHGICDTTTRNYLPQGDPVGLSFVSDLRGRDYAESPSYQDSGDDEDTERSPMLVKDQYCCSNHLSQQPQWHPNIVTEEDPGSPYDNRDFYAPYPVDKAMNCDSSSSSSNFPVYHHKYRPRYMQVPPPPFHHRPYVVDKPNNFDEPPTRDDPGYHPSRQHQQHKRRWMLNQKCKSADSSEPDAFAGGRASSRRGPSPVGYSYGQSANVLEAHIGGDCGGASYLNKCVFSSEGDPVAGPSGLQRPCSINWEVGGVGGAVDGEFRSRSYSLTPTVNFAVFESGSSSETEDAPPAPVMPESAEVPAEVGAKTLEDPFELPVMSLGKVLAISPSAAQLSIASSYGDNGSPICKICHMTAKENDPLISPCRCSGTMQYIHCGCLMRWLEVCHKRGRRPASCELCQYQYHWHKKFKIRHWQFPQCSRKDKILHLLFIFSALLMITCASLTVMFFKQDKGTKVDLNQELTQSEIGNLVCGVLFFVAFFVAIYVEAKSHDTLYKLLVKFIHINQQWYIDEYEKKETAPVAV